MRQSLTKIPFSMVFVQKKIAVGMDVLKFFTMNNWNFKSDKFQNLVMLQSKDEYDMFAMDTKNRNVKDYLRNSLIGGRQYCAKDPLSTIPRAKTLIKMYVKVATLNELLIF